MRALVILPTYNEIENIENVLRLVRETVPSADVLVIDDGSPDGTAERADKVGEQLGNIEVMRRPAKSGLGSAYRAGFRYGIEHGYDAMIEMDSDLSHDPRVLNEIIAPVGTGAALAIGSRYVEGGRIPNWSWFRRAISRFGNRYARVVLGLKVNDATAGYRAYARSALEAIDLDTVKADGYGFQIEMAYLVSRNGGRIVEVPIEFRDRELGQSKMSGKIVVEALTLVTWWGVRDRILRRGRRSA